MILFVYTIAPFFSWPAIPWILGFFQFLNSILNLVGASWIAFNVAPPPPFQVQVLPQFILYWASFTGTTILFAEGAYVVVIGALYLANKETKSGGRGRG